VAAVALLTLLVAARPSADDTALLAEAEVSFAAGVRRIEQPDEARASFRRAADLYEQLRQRGYASAALFRNQGNACLLASDLPGAILAYRRGLRRVPNDRELQERLAYAREQVSYPQLGAFSRPPVSQRPPWLPRLPVRGTLALAVVAFAAGCVSLTRWRMVRRWLLVSLGLGSLTVAGVLAAALAVQEVQDRAEERHPLVVIAEDGVLLRKGDGEAYPRRYDTPLHRGVEARLRFTRGDWVQIELSGGEIGWLPRRYLLIDEP
jgi:hypothetical protein